MAERRLPKALLLILVILLVASTASAQIDSGKAATPGPAANRHADKTPLYSLSDPEVYLLRLADPPLASYRGEIRGLDATSPVATGAAKLDADAPASQAYLGYLAEKQNDVLDAMQLRFGHKLEVLHTYRAAYNGLAVRLTGQEAVEAAALPGVVDVEREFVRYPDTDVGPAWIGAPGVWDGSATGGTATKGEGVIIGVIDTGINFDHPSFADIGGDGYDHTNPFGSGVYVGWCNPAHEDYDPAVHLCNDKLIGAWDYTLDGNKGEDDDGHGSHTASTAGGNFVDATISAPTTTVERAISGVAPHANLITYDTCISGQGCPGAGLVAAIDQAVLDGVDVINYSIGGGPNNPWADSDSQAFLAARDAGVFVATSAGNDGPEPGTVGSPANSPWLLSVGAVTHNRQFVNALTNMTGGDTAPPPDLWGVSITSGYGPAPIVHAKDYGDALCLNEFPAATWENGEIVVCDRGVNARVDKGWNVLQGGAGGYVLANTAVDSEAVVADAHYLPAVHIGWAAAQQLLPWLDSGSGHMATIVGTTIDLSPANGDIMASFSSRGPNLPVPGVIKPDVAAPGVAIIAASKNGIEFESMGGTSMASPHAAGAAALLTALHPDWTPAQMQSALMTTAVPDNVLKEDSATAADPFDRGGGRIDVSRAAQAGLVLDETTNNFEDADPGLDGDPTTLNLASLANSACYPTCSWTRTVKSALDTAADWTVSVTGASPGLEVTVSPTSFRATGAGPIELQIDADTTGFNAANDGANDWGFASIVLESAGQETLHIPLAVKKPYTSSPLLVSKEPNKYAAPTGAIVEYTIQVTNRDSVPHIYSLTDTLPAGVEYVASSATGGLVYDPGTRELTWQGEIDAGAIEYQITEIDPLPYVNLGALGASGICATYFPDDCDDVTLSWGLGSYSYTFYGETLTEVDQSSNSMIFGPEGWLGSACSACNQLLPEPQEINQVLAGLWRDILPGAAGQGEFYGALIDGLLANPADVVFYGNWHDVGQYGDLAITSRHAIAIVMDGQSEPAGRIYYIYDDITGDLTT
ncbi:MAG: S8 family serine peptidase, partial [Anaerolineae bacterium]